LSEFERNRKTILQNKSALIDERNKRQQDHIEELRHQTMKEQALKKVEEQIRLEKKANEEFIKKQQEIDKQTKQEERHNVRIKKLMEQRELQDQKAKISEEIMRENFERKEQLRKKFLTEKIEIAKKSGNLKKYNQAKDD